MSWHAFYFDPRNNWENRLLNITKTRFSNQYEVEEAFCYAEERLTKSNFNKLGDFNNAINPTALLIASYKNLLVNFQSKLIKQRGYRAYLFDSNMSKEELSIISGRQDSLELEESIVLLDYLAQLTNFKTESRFDVRTACDKLSDKVAWLVFGEEYTVQEVSSLLELPYHRVNYSKKRFISSCLKRASSLE